VRLERGVAGSRYSSSLPAAQTSAVARDAADRSQTSDANQPDYNAGQSAYATGRFVEALRIWRPLAESGDPRAAFGLGLLYDLGEGVGQDAAAAYVWYRTAAEAGVVAAEFNIAVMCDSGVGTARNAAEAAVWYASAAAHGIARAEYNLAQLSPAMRFISASDSLSFVFSIAVIASPMQRQA